MVYALTEWLRGSVRVQVRGAFPLHFINACARRNLEFRKAEPEDEFSISLSLRRRDLRRARELAERSQCTLSVTGERGAICALRRVRKRYALLASLLLCCAALLWSSLHIWDMRVIGAEKAKESEILSALDHAGVRIGSFWPDFTNEQIKCSVLREVPELSWLSVNVSGSQATVSVRERVPAPEVYDEEADVHLTAAKPGLITEMHVMQGTAAAEKGQTVLPGELLVSGVMPSSFEKAPTRYVHAKASVYARTWYSLCACAPLERAEKVYTGKTRRHFALEIGNRRINLYNVADNSRNLNTEYDKLINTYRLAVKDVFTTPLAVVTETYSAYSLVPVQEDERLLFTELTERLNARLRQEIGKDGEVKAQNFSCEERDGYLYVTLRAECVEDIAQEQRFIPEPSARTEE